MLDVGTTEGVWSMDDDGTYWYAGVQPLPNNDGWADSFLFAVSDLMPGDQKFVDYMETLLDSGCRVVLDSGVFSLAARHARKHQISHDEALRIPVEEIDGYDELMARWRHIVNLYRDRLWGYIEVDLGGVEGKRRTRAMLEGEGYRPIPVVHPLNDGWDYFEEMADTYDRLCVGNLVTASRTTREDIFRNIAERRQGRKVQWIHALGVTSSDLWLAYRTESCDSSSMISVLRYGGPIGEYSAFKKSAAVGESYSTKHRVEAARVVTYMAGNLDMSTRAIAGTLSNDRRVQHA